MRVDIIVFYGNTGCTEEIRAVWCGGAVGTAVARDTAHTAHPTVTLIASKAVSLHCSPLFVQIYRIYYLSCDTHLDTFTLTRAIKNFTFISFIQFHVVSTTNLSLNIFFCIFVLKRRINFGFSYS